MCVYFLFIQEINPLTGVMFQRKRYTKKKRGRMSIEIITKKLV